MESPTSSSKIYRAGTLTYTKGALAILFFWLLWGDFCFVLMETIVPSIMPLRFKALGAPNLIMGLALVSIPAAINLVCNPIISFRSDRYRSRWGRRIPFIFFTAPFLVLCVVGLAFSERIGPWLHAHFAVYLGQLSPEAVTIIIMTVLLIGFSFFNTFVNSVYWYLFNDVVPEHLLARFMSMFRLVSTASSSVYSLLIFKHADTHFVEIFVGVGILYFLGFGLMCLKVKEGNYPPPPKYVDGEDGPVAAIKTYAKECMSLPHYWYVFLVNMGLIAAGATGLYGVFLQKSMGMTLEDIGELAFAGSISSAVAIVACGWLADKYHPIRVVLVGTILQTIISPIGLMWLFWHPSPHIYFCVALVLGAGLSAPVTAMVWVQDPPLFMRIFPRERYGQFCSANSMCRSVAAIIAGPLVGEYLDIMTKFYGADNAYRLMPLWSFTFHSLVLLTMIKLYRSWHSHGGDDAYAPPMIGSGGIHISDNLPDIPQPGP